MVLPWTREQVAPMTAADTTWQPPCTHLVKEIVHTTAGEFVWIALDDSCDEECDVPQPVHTVQARG